MNDEMTDSEILNDLREQIAQMKINIPTMREPKTASYYKQMLLEAIEQVEQMEPDAPEGRVKPYVPVTAKRPARKPRKWWAWAYRLYLWTHAFPEEFHLFCYGVGIGATVVAIIAVAIIL